MAVVFVVNACSSGTSAASPSTQGPQGPAAQSGGPTVSLPSGTPEAVPSLAPATIELWLGGILSTATAGTSYLQWVNDTITRFKSLFPGSNVNITLLPQNNDEAAAQVAAALSAGNAPDVMMLYSGTMTSAYASKLTTLNPYIDATPGFYDSLTEWDASCANFDCQNGKGVIFGVPADVNVYANFYRKDLFAKAGIASPPKTWDEVFADCAKFKAIGVYGYIWGDRDGYATVTTIDEDLPSILQPGEWKGGLNNTLKFTDPRFITELTTLTKLRQIGCVQPDYATREQLDSANDILTGKGAMFVGQPQFLPYWSTIIDEIGVAPVPQSGNGPDTGTVASASNDDWVIPSDAKHPELAWQLIKLFTDETSGLQMPSLFGAPSPNKAAQAATTDPLVKAIGLMSQNASMPMYDNVVPQDVALYWYKELNLAFAGKVTPEAAMQVVQQQMDKDFP
jgi:ABC-type glycerol-3-phosphate transport system substrate-binding protein